MEIRKIIEKVLIYWDITQQFGEGKKEFLSPKSSVLENYCRKHYCPVCDLYGYYEKVVDSMLLPYNLSFIKVEKLLDSYIDRCIINAYFIDGLIRGLDGENMDVLIEERRNLLGVAIAKNAAQLEEKRKELIAAWRVQFAKKIQEISDDFEHHMKNTEGEEISLTRFSTLSDVVQNYRKEIRIEFES